MENTTESRYTLKKKYLKEIKITQQKNARLKDNHFENIIILQIYIEVPAGIIKIKIDLKIL